MFISERAAREWLEMDESPFRVEKRPQLAAEIDIDRAGLTGETVRALEALFQETEAFGNSPGRLRDYLFHLELQDGARPVRGAPRNVGPAQRELLSRWAKQQLESGLWERASPACQWASSLHIAPTYVVGEDGEPRLKKIRVCGDYRRVNEELDTVAQVIPNIDAVKRTLVGFQYYAKFDLANGFGNLELAPDSRDVLAVRTPLGLLRPTRLPFGPKNNPSKFQKLIEGLVCDHELFGKQIFVFIDDLMVGANSEAELLSLVRDVLRRVVEAGVKLKPSKARVGYPMEVVLGSEVSADGIRPSAEHTAAVSRIGLPRSAKEVRSLVGMLTYWHHHFEDFSRRMAPLYPLMKESVPFPSELPEAVVSAIAGFKKDMAQRPMLRSFDPNLPLFLETDASDAGAGVIAFHKVDGRHCPIAYFSKKFSPAESRWPPYVREAFAVVFALRKCRDMVQASGHQTTVITDHHSLKWIYAAKSPKVERWVVETVQDLDFRVVYRPGPENLGADAFSRVPCIAPGQVTDVGEAVALERLLRAVRLPGPQAGRHTIWMFSASGSLTLPESLLRKGRVVVTKAPSRRNLQGGGFDVGILIPDAARSPPILREMLLGNKPFAVLLPSDLVHLSYSPRGGGELTAVDEKARDRLGAAKKIVFLQSNLTWVIGGWPGSEDQVFAFEARGGSAAGSRPRLRKAPSRARVKTEQELETREQDPSTAVEGWLSQVRENGSVTVDGGQLLLAEDGLLVFQSAAAPVSLDRCPVVLPRALVEETIHYVHRDLNHARAGRLAPYIAQRYWWPTVTADVTRFLRDCHFCLVAKARRVMKHGRYSSMKLDSPHQGYGVDVWGPTVKSDQGYRYILTVVDLFHGYVRFYPLRTKSANEMMSVMVNQLFSHSGVPSFILSDCDAAFRSELAQAYCRAMGVDWLFTAPYSAWELGRVERRHRELNVAVKALTVKTSWPDHLPGAAARAYNSLVSSATGVCPSEVEYGREPVGPLDQTLGRLAKLTVADLPSESASVVMVRQHVESLREAQRLYTNLVKSFADKARQRGVDQKNSESKRRVAEVQVGDRVTVERPTKKRGVPAKTLIQWRGPYRVVEKVSSNRFRCEHEDGSSVTVSRSQLNPYTARNIQQGVAERLEASQPQGERRFVPGQLIAVGDHEEEDEGNHRFQLARFVRPSAGPDENWVEVEFLGTTTARPPYRFRDVWIDQKDGKAILKNTKPRTGGGVSDNVLRWTGKVHVDLILDREVSLLKSGALTKKSLKNLGPWRSQVVG
jgi:hypothetical protein